MTKTIRPAAQGYRQPRSAGLLHVAIEPELSQMVGEVDGAPIRTKRRLRTAAIIKPSDIIIVVSTLVQNLT